MQSKQKAVAMKLAKSRLKNRVRWYHYIPSLSLYCVCLLIAGIQALDNHNLAMVKGEPYIRETIVQAKEEVQPELKQISFTPDQATRTLIKKYPDLTAKIKETFGDDWTYVAQLLKEESSFNKYAVNPSSGACGLGQSLPCSKMACELSDEQCQLDWIKSYIKNRYKTPQRALEFWNNQKETTGSGWY